ncbi:hypothetical protein COLO4_12341 [Corchorus olitorius]|uniref:Uncharacterized protein n=1 Tax=Corchorus olitorius TaxID=93759 RepID=A0A1R3K168_9ROSI|nr:hypothetical protein COLO4_12341 [Corchorus olitorius]
MGQIEIFTNEWVKRAMMEERKRVKTRCLI